MFTGSGYDPDRGTEAGIAAHLDQPSTCEWTRLDTLSPYYIYIGSSSEYKTNRSHNPASNRNSDLNTDTYVSCYMCD